MVPRIKDREKSIELRKHGLSYREIREQVKVSKSSLSLWLRSVGLSQKQKQRLTEKKLAAARRGSAKLHQLKIQKIAKIKKEARSEIGLISRHERWLAGVLLYWAEGSKEREHGYSTDIKFSNSDPLMILLFRKWLHEFYSIPLKKMRYELYIHEKADWEGAKKYWASRLNILPEQFHVYFKRHNPKPKRKNIGSEYHGLIRLTVYSTKHLVRKISGWVEGICEHCGVV